METKTSSFFIAFRSVLVVKNFSAKLPKPTEDPDSQPFPGLILWMGSDDPLIEVADIIKDEIWYLCISNL